MLYTAWTFGSIQRACTEQQQFLVRVHAAFFNYHHINEMTNLPNEIVLARIMTPLDLEFEKGTALPWQEIWHWKWLWTTRSSYEACVYLFSLNNWGLLQSCRLQRSTMSHLSLHTKVSQVLVAFLPRSPPMPNLWWDTPTRNGTPMMKRKISLQLTLMIWYVLKSLCPITANNCASTTCCTILPDKQTHPCNPSRKKYPQSQNKWIWRYWITYQTSLIHPKNFYLTLTLGQTVC